MPALRPLVGVASWADTPAALHDDDKVHGPANELRTARIPMWVHRSGTMDPRVGNASVHCQCALPAGHTRLLPPAGSIWSRSIWSRSRLRHSNAACLQCLICTQWSVI